MHMNNTTESVLRAEIAKLQRSIAKLEGMLPDAPRVYEFDDRVAVRATEIYDHVGDFDLGGDDFAEPKVVTGYVVSSPDGREEYESEYMAEAYEYLDSVGDEPGWIIGMTFSDGTTSYEHQPRRPAAARKAFA